MEIINMKTITNKRFCKVCGIELTGDFDAIWKKVKWIYFCSKCFNKKYNK